MKQLSLLFSLLLFSLAAICQAGGTDISIIPEPVSVVKRAGKFILPKTVLVKIPNRMDLGHSPELLKERFMKSTGSVVKISSAITNSNAHISLEINKAFNPNTGDEGYTLSVSPGKVIVKANKPAGLYYGIQTLLQLFPPEIESDELIKNVKWEAPSVEITDRPLVGWRGLMLDVSRHFFTVKEVKQYIDAMVKYKFNLLHWHLTDDEGWRIQIKSLPKLTDIGAWRVYKVGEFGKFSQPTPDEKRDYGGFYTQEEVKEIVAYAKKRFVDVMPEIDVPGHSLAAVASYPELSCTPGADQYVVSSGEPVLDWTHPTGPKALVDNTLCPANEKVYDFLDKVMTEVAPLFPFEYIHVGGDETTFNFWEKSAQIKALMKREGLKTFPDVQNYFGNRLEKIVHAKGKKMMGWDGMLHEGISPTAAVTAYWNSDFGIQASKKNHYVVMTPHQYTYIDLMQGDPSTEPWVYGTLRLNQAYQFNPVPKEANAKYILGGQACLWTDKTYNIRQAEYMTWPRSFAISESVWSPQEKKDWNKFVDKTEVHFKRLNASETKYSPALYDPIIAVRKSDDKYYVNLATEIDGLDIYTSFDNSSPDRFYPKYKEPLLIPKDAILMRVITYRGKEPIGRLMTLTVEDLKARAQ